MPKTKRAKYELVPPPPYEQKCICGCPRLLHSGTFYKDVWFCSHTCVQTQKEDEKLDLLADFDGTDYRGMRTN